MMSFFKKNKLFFVQLYSIKPRNISTLRKIVDFLINYSCSLEKRLSSTVANSKQNFNVRLDFFKKKKGAEKWNAMCHLKLFIKNFIVTLRRFVVVVIVWRASTPGQTQAGLGPRIYPFTTQTAALPESDSGSGVIKPASSFIIQNRQTSCSM